MQKVNKKLIIVLVVSLLLLLLLLLYRDTKRKEPRWDEVYQKTSISIDSGEAEQELKSCSAAGRNDCDKLLESSAKKLEDADFFYSGYEFCIKKFGKQAEDCKKLLENLLSQEDIKNLAPSTKASRDGIE